jgi:hypothetical protein
MSVAKSEEIGEKKRGRPQKATEISDIGESLKSQARAFRKAEHESDDYKVETSEDYALRLLEIAKTAHGEGDFAAEMAALKQIAGARGLDVWENVAQIAHLPNKQLLDMLERLVLPELLSYGVDVLKPSVFEEIVEIIWHHEIEREQAPDFIVKYLRARMLKPRGRARKEVPVAVDQ